MAADNRKKGSLAEMIAEQYLQSLGFHLVQKNFFYGRYGEIDLIVRDGNTLVFVEVKARYSEKFGTAEEAVTPRKIAHLRLAAEGYRQIFSEYDTECRFDVITIQYSSGEPVIVHYPNAF